MKRHYIRARCATQIIQTKKKLWSVKKNHKILETATIIGEYKSKGAINDGMPVKIKIKFKGADRWVVYKR